MASSRASSPSSPEFKRKTAAAGRASIPEKYLYWVAQKKPVWAPHYTIHKTFMGLVDAWKVAGNQQALEIAENFAPWFHEWSGRFSREQFNDILDTETGGMLEVWADLYGATGKSTTANLMDRYYRPRLFDRLLEGKDVLTNKHANTTIPEAQGMARAYEVTGESKWRDAALAYWKCAVTTRGAVRHRRPDQWRDLDPARKALRPPGRQEPGALRRLQHDPAGGLPFPLDRGRAIRRLHRTQPAQRHPGPADPQTGMVTYFLPLAPGRRRRGALPRTISGAAHGTLVQAQSRHDRYIYYSDGGDIVIAQYIPSEASWSCKGTPVRIAQTMLREADDHRVDIEDPASRPTLGHRDPRRRRSAG